MLKVHTTVCMADDIIINPYQGTYQEIHPCMAGSIDSVKINTSLLMMREW